MAALMEEAEVIARSRLGVALTGPSGTGKTRLASALHAASGRTGRFEEVDCGAADGSLLRAELFGTRQVRESTGDENITCVPNGDGGCICLRGGGHRDWGASSASTARFSGGRPALDLDDHEMRERAPT